MPSQNSKLHSTHIEADAKHPLARMLLEPTAMLLNARSGRRDDLDALFPLVYAELRRRAHAYLRDEQPDHTLSTTALVHEAYLELIDIERVEYRDRAHFMAVAARAMRRILVDSARRRQADKRGGGATTLSLDDAHPVSVQQSDQMVALDGALERLAAESERLALTVELRFFAGLTIEETARAMDLAPSTVQLDWTKAKAWLYRELADT